MEDELREITSRHLQNLGYNTVETKNGDHAFQLVQQRNDIDLMFSDVVMPGQIDGFQLGVRVLNEYPDIKVLLASGFTKQLGDGTDDSSASLEGLAGSLLRNLILSVNWPVLFARCLTVGE